MFERDVVRQLKAWKTDANRKPLVVHGARQVGKTWVLKYFGKEYFEDVAYSKMVPQWEETLKNGNYINSPVDKIPEQSVLEHYGIESVFVIPIFIDGVFWGGVLFEDLTCERTFTEAQSEVLRSASQIMASAVKLSEEGVMPVTVGGVAGWSPVTRSSSMGPS